ncbi:hypothetical protein NC653_020079 [Populus alba x Populus x berolinensis]|uniref:Uncharacterized protein n=1 Tax=Populus alba x Populus x berolinensis TaxID=444605 RepID=A0AAD6QC11_9ROSI|nr:hypothetical protein NC653_020079 [Populus alba x Populus x berolinensis]
MENSEKSLKGCVPTGTHAGPESTSNPLSKVFLYCLKESEKNGVLL